jgi:DnaK suppressor protein
MASPRKVSLKQATGTKIPERKRIGEKPARSKAALPKTKAKAADKSAGLPAKPKGKTVVRTPPVPSVPEKPTARRKPVPSKSKTVPLEVKPLKPTKPTRPAKPARPVVDAEWQRAVREALVSQRRRMLSVVQATQAQMAEQVGDLPDVSDRASEGYGDELAAELLAIEAAQLDEIEAAIRRIDNETYGLCLDCAKPIPRKRLEVLPFAQRCLRCKNLRERTTATLDSQTADEEEEEPESESDNEDREDSN